jgi:hypothetical protein
MISIWSLSGVETRVHSPRTILLERNGELFQLTKEENIWVDYDAQRARLALEQSAGVFNDVDRKGLLEDTHLSRQQDSHSRPV